MKAWVLAPAWLFCDQSSTPLTPLHKFVNADDDGVAAAAAAQAAVGAEGRPLRLWYGSHSLLDQWVHVLQ